MIDGSSSIQFDQMISNSVTKSDYLYSFEEFLLLFQIAALAYLFLRR